MDFLSWLTPAAALSMIAAFIAWLARKVRVRGRIVIETRDPPPE
jgi:hypothetical protein